MFKRGMFVLVCLTAMTSAWAWAATSFQLQTKITNAGGQLQVGTKPIQSATDSLGRLGSLVFSNYTTANAIPVTVTANTGYTISSIIQNRAAIPAAVGATTYPASVVKSAGAVQALVVSFAPTTLKLTITTSAGTGGTVHGGLLYDSVQKTYGYPTSYQVLPNSAGVLTIAPDLSTGKVVSVTVPTGWTVADLNGNPPVYPYQGVLKASKANITASGTVSATFSVAPVLGSLTAAQQAAYATCSCHTSQGQSPMFATWAASKHAAATSRATTCSDCHVGMAIPATADATALCSGCHRATLSTTTHPVALTETKCITCHDPHNPAAGIANLGTAPAHPAVTLYTFEEIGMQMAGGAKVPVQVDANGKGMPYSPKQTCGTSGCHIKNGVDYTYDKISDHAFHSNEGRSEYQDSSDGKFNATKNKPWTQSTAMVGKW